MTRVFKGNKVLVLSAIMLVGVFTCLDLIGSFGPVLMKNGLCFQYLGCNTGFFGYDMLVHFMSGAATAAALIWAIDRFTSLPVLERSFLTDLLVVVSLVVLVAFLWEFAELIGDQYRILVLHENVLFPNTLLQPSNLDTMGDLIAAFIGSLVASPLLLFRKR